MPKNDKDKKQLEILRFIYETVEKCGFPPTVREICAAVDLSSTSTVHGHIARLQRKGFLIKDATKPRAIEVTDEGRKAIGVAQDKIPMLDNSNDAPISALEDMTATGYFPTPPDLHDYTDDLFMLTITQDNLTEAGILSGDQVIVGKQDTTQVNDIVVIATDDNRITIKRLSSTDLPKASILGKVIRLYRQNIN